MMEYSFPATCSPPASSWFLLGMLLLGITPKEMSQAYCTLTEHEVIHQNCNFDWTLPEFLSRAGHVLGRTAPDLDPARIQITQARNKTGIWDWSEISPAWQQDWTKQQVGFFVEMKQKKYFVGISRIYVMDGTVEGVGQWELWQ